MLAWRAWGWAAVGGLAEVLTAAYSGANGVGCITYPIDTVIKPTRKVAVYGAPGVMVPAVNVIQVTSR